MLILDLFKSTGPSACLDGTIFTQRNKKHVIGESICLCYNNSTQRPFYRLLCVLIGSWCVEEKRVECLLMCFFYSTYCSVHSVHKQSNDNITCRNTISRHSFCQVLYHDMVIHSWVFITTLHNEPIRLPQDQFGILTQGSRSTQATISFKMDARFEQGPLQMNFF